MKSEFVEVFITEDGTRFDDRGKALKHEEKVGGKHFKTEEELLTFLKNTNIWKVWEIGIDGANLDIYDLHTQVEKLAADLAIEYPKIIINKKKRILQVNLEKFIWDKYQDKAIVEYFNSYTHLKFSEEKILQLYRMAYSENHSYGLVDTVSEFTIYIDVLNKMYPEE